MLLSRPFDLSQILSGVRYHQSSYMCLFVVIVKYSSGIRLSHARPPSKCLCFGILGSLCRSSGTFALLVTRWSATQLSQQNRDVRLSPQHPSVYHNTTCSASHTTADILSNGVPHAPTLRRHLDPRPRTPAIRTPNRLPILPDFHPATHQAERLQADRAHHEAAECLP